MPPTSGGTRRCTASRAPAPRPCFRRRSAWRPRFDPTLMHEVATAISDEARAKHHEFERRGLRGALPGPDVLVAEHQHLPRSALGPRPGDLRRGSLPHRAHGRRVRHGAAGRRSAATCKVDRDGQALRRAQRTRGGPPPLRRAPERARSLRDLPARLPRARAGRRTSTSVMGAYNRVNGESASASPRLLQRHPAQATGASRATSSPTATRSTTSTSITRSWRRAEAAAALGVKNGLRPRLRQRPMRRSASAVAAGLIAEKRDRRRRAAPDAARASGSACSIRPSACAGRRFRTP